MTEHLNPTQWLKEYIDDLQKKKTEAEINLDALPEILAKMQATKESIVEKIGLCQQEIERLEQDPTYEARQKRKTAEEDRKKHGETLEKQEEQIKNTLKVIEGFENEKFTFGVLIEKAKKRQ